jgi:hypothetical protein
MKTALDVGDDHSVVPQVGCFKRWQFYGENATSIWREYFPLTLCDLKIFNLFKEEKVKFIELQGVIC